MAKEKGFILPTHPVIENTGQLLTDVEEAKEDDSEEKNTKLLEQISHKLDLLLSVEGE